MTFAPHRWQTTEEARLELRQADGVLVVWLHAGLALAVFVLAWLYHLREAPYAFPFQNVLESYLIGASMLVILLGALYTFVPRRLIVLEAVLSGA